MKQIDIPVEILESEGIRLPSPWKLQYYKELGRRELWIDDYIGEETIDVIKKIREWNQEDKEWRVKNEEYQEDRISMIEGQRLLPAALTLPDKPLNYGKPITIYFHSDGGDLEMSLAIASAIKGSKIPVHGHNIGNCASGAALIYSQCDVRTAEDTASFLIHKGGTNGGSMTYQQTKKMQGHYNWLVDKMMELIYSAFNAEKLDREKFDELADSEWFLYSGHSEVTQDARRLGWITTV